MTPTLAELSDIANRSTSRTDIWKKVLTLSESRTIAEIGVWKGDFARELLTDLPFITRYYMIDPWANLPDWNKPFNVEPEIFEQVHEEALAKTEFAASKRTVLRGRTKEISDNIPNESLDFAYIDGDHTLRGITIDLIRLFPKIKPGGIIGGDDFISTPWQHSLEFEPTMVCPLSIYFCEAMNIPIVALPHNQFFIRKTVEENFSFTDLTGHYRDLSLNKLPPSEIRTPPHTRFTSWCKKIIRHLS